MLTLCVLRGFAAVAHTAASLLVLSARHLLSPCAEVSGAYRASQQRLFGFL